MVFSYKKVELSLALHALLRVFVWNPPVQRHDRGVNLVLYLVVVRNISSQVFHCLVHA